MAMDDHRKRILIITQTPPADSGRGTRMRIGMSMEALAKLGDVSLLIITQRALAVAEGVPEKYRTLCGARVLLLKDADARSTDKWRGILRLKPTLLASWNHDWLNSDELAVMTGEYDLVWVFRLRMWPIFESLEHRGLISTSARILDIDDIESRACYRRAMLLGRSLGRLGFVTELLECVKLRISEARAAKVFDKLLVCSDADKKEFVARTRAKNIETLPNGIRTPSSASDGGTSANKGEGSKRTILFVGSLDFYPNVEGLLWMSREVLPQLKALAAPFQFIVVGRNPDPRITALAAEGLFELYADVPDVAPYYARASMVVAPIHAGSGTRIKILEAFAFGVPVVSTTLGAEGLETQHRVHLATADTPANFAREIVALLDDPIEGQNLARNAARLLNENFSLSAICERIESLVDSVSPIDRIFEGQR